MTRPSPRAALLAVALAAAIPVSALAQAQPAPQTAPAQAPPAAGQPVGTLEAIGAQKCGGNAAAIRAEFMAPEEASLVANATVVGAEAGGRATATLTLDGRDCGDEGCSFRAAKGHRYQLAAARRPGQSGELCVSVTRP